MAEFTDDFSPEADEADVRASLEHLHAARDTDVEERFAADFEAPAGSAYRGALSPFVKWMGSLPKNVGVGVLDAALAAGEFVEDTVELAAPEDGGEASSATPKRGNPAVLGNEPLSAVDLGAFEAARQFRDYLAEGSNTADQVTQGIAQFVVPFVGWSKAFGGISKANSLARNLLTAAGAEVATSSVNLMPDTGRTTDLLELGRHTENRFGDALRIVAPDDSLVNSYINWMSDREDEGPWEGRFKNSVDSLVTSAAAAGVIKAAASSFRAARSIFGRVADQGQELKKSLVFDDEAKATYERVTDTILNRYQDVRAEAGGTAKTAERPIAMADLIADLDKAIPADDPYRVVVDKLLKQDLQGKVRILGDKAYKELAGETSVGKSFTRAHRENDEIVINLDTALKTGRAREAVGYTAMHELVHAGTTRNMRRNPDFVVAIKELSDKTKELVPDAPKYGHTNAFEFVAEAFSNMKFQNAMKKADTWEPFIKQIGSIFGISGAALIQLESLIQQPKEARADG